MSAPESTRSTGCDLVTNLVPDDAPSKKREVRLNFLNEVLPRIPAGPREDLTAICKAWLKVTGAKWIWLWLKHSDENGDKNPWELTAVAAQDGNTNKYVPDKDEFFSIGSDKNCVAKFANADPIKRPVFVDNIKEWKKKLDGVDAEFEVIAREELDSRGCVSLLAVPLIFGKPSKQPTSGRADYYSNIRYLCGLVCAHFDVTKSPADLQDEVSYKLMGQATTSAIVTSFAENQRTVLDKMDLLATEYLTKDSSTEKNRTDYLKKVIALIRDYLQVDCVSVFYKTLLDEEVIECIASTGLYRDGGSERVADNDLKTIRYIKEEGVTGKIYSSDKPYVSAIGTKGPRPEGMSPAKSSEYQNDRELTKYNHSWVGYPISIVTSGKDQGSSIRTPVGVLRCVGNKSELKREFQRNFDPIQLQTIAFITSQLAPVLETMFNQIRRERYVTIIKHDLYNPLRLVEAGIDDITSENAPDRLPLNWEDKMTFALKLARNLAGSLSEKESFEKKSTFLFRDVINPMLSGLRDYAGVENGMKMGTVIENNADKDAKKDKKAPLCLNIDPELVERAFLNLVINAVKYGERGSEIKIIGEQTNADYRLHVSNEGMGVDPAEREKIFTGEYRSPKVRNFKQGLGLGLKIAKAAMERNRGRLELTNLRNPTTFTLVFPNEIKEN